MRYAARYNFNITFFLQEAKTQFTLLQRKENTLGVFNSARHELSMFMKVESHRCSGITDHTLNQLGGGHVAKWSKRPERL